MKLIVTSKGSLISLPRFNMSPFVDGCWCGSFLYRKSMVVSTYRSSPFQNIPDSKKRNQSRIANLESTSGNRVFFGMIYIFSFESL